MMNIACIGIPAVQTGLAGIDRSRFFGPIFRREIALSVANSGLTFREVHKRRREEKYSWVDIHFLGQKTAFLGDTPVWAMYYRGHCREKFLHFFLRAMIRDREGRLGNHQLVHHEGEIAGVRVAYENRVLFPGNAKRFAEDAILHTMGRKVVSVVYGQCTFFGGDL